MVHTKSIKLVLITIDSHLSASLKCDGQGVFFKKNTLMEGGVHPH